MPYRPSAWLERLAGALVPPASREHVLGDLAECSGSTRQYAATLAPILPRVLWCQIRRRATIGGLVFHALLSGAVLVAAQRVGGGSFLDEPRELFALAAPWAVWIVGCALAAAYGPADKPLSWNSRVFFATVAAALAVGAAADVPVLRLAAGLGTTFAVSFVLAMPFAAAGQPPPLSIETLPRHVRLFQKGIWWRNAREQAVGAGLVVMSAGKLPSATGADLWAQLLMIGGITFVVAFMFLKASPRRMPGTSDVRVLRQFFRLELTRQRDLLRMVPLWYLFPFVPGFLAMSLAEWDTAGIGALGGIPVLAVVFWVVWALNKAAAGHLDSQVNALDALPQPEGD